MSFIAEDVGGKSISFILIFFYFLKEVATEIPEPPSLQPSWHSNQTTSYGITFQVVHAVLFCFSLFLLIKLYVKFEFFVSF